MFIHVQKCFPCSHKHEKTDLCVYLEVLEREATHSLDRTMHLELVRFHIFQI